MIETVKVRFFRIRKKYMKILIVKLTFWRVLTTTTVLYKLKEHGLAQVHKLEVTWAVAFQFHLVDITKTRGIFDKWLALWVMERTGMCPILTAWWAKVALGTVFTNLAFRTSQMWTNLLLHSHLGNTKEASWTKHFMGLELVKPI